MAVAEVAGMEGVGGEVSGLIRLWKCVENILEVGDWKLKVRRRGKIRTIAKTTRVRTRLP